jgi:Flp pilus assembly protein TadG
MQVRSSERGAAVLEFALVVVLLMMFIYGIAAFGILLATKNNITHAAAEGARSALSVSDLPAATLDARRITQAQNTVASRLSYLGSKYQASDTSATIGLCNASDPADTSKCITVTITYPWSARPIIPSAPGLGIVMPNNLRATAVVRLS